MNHSHDHTALHTDPSFTSKHIVQILLRGWRKQCPVCGEKTMFSSYFTMRDRCANCGVNYNREDGEYVASMYLSIMIITVIFVAVYVVLEYGFNASLTVELIVLVALNGLFPIWFYPRSKSLWAAALHLMGRLYPD
ncbi:MAG: DUF983 domain-containing protein [Bacteroidetes bacterium]|nr:DUF983 domain-containing protein [Bacteroidota bacterium]